MEIKSALPLLQPLAAEAQTVGIDTMSKAFETAPKSSPKTCPDYSKYKAARRKLVASLVRKVRLLPEVRAEKIEAIKAAIADGSYDVDSAQVAQALIEHMLLEGLRKGPDTATPDSFGEKYGSTGSASR